MAITSRRQLLSAPDACARTGRRWFPGAAAAAVAALLAGCQDAHGPLAARDSFFASPPPAVGHIGLATGTTIEAYQDLVAIQRACGAARASIDPQAETGIPCRPQTTRFFGRRAEAYRRWVEDQVRELPAPGVTASRASE